MNLKQIEYEYEKTLLELEEYLTDTGSSDIPEEFLERLNINKDEMATKIEHYLYFKGNLKAEQEAIDARIKTLQAKKASKEKLIDYLEDRIIEVTRTYGTATKSGGASLKLPMTTVTAVRYESYSATRPVPEATLPKVTLSFNWTQDKKEVTEFIAALQKLEEKKAFKIKVESEPSKSLLKDLYKDKDLPEGIVRNTTFSLRTY